MLVFRDAFRELVDLYKVGSRPTEGLLKAYLALMSLPLLELGLLGLRAGNESPQ